MSIEVWNYLWEQTTEQVETTLKEANNLIFFHRYLAAEIAACLFADLSIIHAHHLQFLFGKQRKPPATCRAKIAKNGTLEKFQQKMEVKTIANKKNQEFHLFYAVGDDEIQIESHDKKRNKDILKLVEQAPDAVTILDADDAPYYLRAAIKAENVSLHFKPALSESARKVRAENGRKNAANLKNSKLSKSK